MGARWTLHLLAILFLVLGFCFALVAIGARQLDQQKDGPMKPSTPGQVAP